MYSFRISTIKHSPFMEYCPYILCQGYSHPVHMHRIPKNIRSAIKYHPERRFWFSNTEANVRDVRICDACYSRLTGKVTCASCGLSMSASIAIAYDRDRYDNFLEHGLMPKSMCMCFKCSASVSIVSAIHMTSSLSFVRNSGISWF